MGYFVNGLAKIENLKSVSTFIIQILCKVFNSGQELSFTRMFLSKSMLIGVQDVIVFQVLHDAPINNMLHYFT